MRFPRSRRPSWRQRRVLVRLALAAAVAILIISRYTSPRSLFQPVPEHPASSERR